jgi:glycosyltransferase involved in cell wall biosynthesis
MEVPLISICVPTYQRAALLARLFESIGLGNSGDVLEVVIVDDGSTDGTDAAVESLRNKYGGAVRYSWQRNAGRASALHRAITEATGKYLIPMDSDDYFLPGWFDRVCRGLDTLRRAPVIDGRKVHSLIFNVDFSAAVPFSPVGPGFRTNLLAFRADHGAIGDMKELAEANAMKSCLYEVPRGCRRVPTSLIWARMANLGDSLYVPEALIRKEYLPGGMTAQVGRLKMQNPAPIMELNEVIAESVTYRSRVFRWRARLQWARYSLHSGTGRFNRIWKVVALVLALPLYLTDLGRYRRKAA